MYGQNIRLPGELIVKTENNEFSSEFVNKLKTYFNQIQSNISHHKSTENIFIPKSLSDCKFVFMQNENKKPGL